MGWIARILGRAPVDRTWRKRVDTNYLISDDAAASAVTEMRFGYHGEIFIKFSDGRETCVWPTGSRVGLRKVGVRLNRPTSNCQTPGDLGCSHQQPFVAKARP